MALGLRGNTRTKYPCLSGREGHFMEACVVGHCQRPVPQALDEV